MVEVLTLEDDPRTTGVRGELRHLREDARTPGVGPVQPHELLGEARVDLRLLVLGVQLVEGRDERLRDEPAPELPEVRALAGGQGRGDRSEADRLLDVARHPVRFLSVS